ncbi:hypothetical protein EIN_249450 [Entamoeba invadens IP1]|uniref:AmmeMemoRadiSam system protein B n=1 Tax=Entamoeba invadens IP1 TaxID=370355 RepID=A0A0A1UE75_ENTIV|nr:hypothetical protein EIN_249450 [Entamoeba invadens IP1]ELP94901.1 hypothetical protein EIN_249450 [Entamoeba invadens IP1]|eukprot:XP_004261672.1 hypothetical protein EIN_249450 [Entamoeba invadens IP1]
MDTTTTRHTAGDGRWFQSSTNGLKNEVNGYIQDAYKALPKLEGKVLGSVAPHAGFRYSGPTAGFSVAALLKDSETNGKPDVVFILGFSHSAHFEYAAIMDGAAIKSPICTSKIDTDAINIFMKDRPNMKLKYNPHNGEHSAENEIPFVQVAFPETKVVMVLIGTHKAQVFKEVSDGLLEVSKTRKMYVVASSDMLHDEDFNLVEKTDRVTADLTENVDFDGLLKNWSYENQIFCGITAVVPLMMYCKAVGCKKAITADLTNSEKVTGKRNSGWVVGYGAFIFVL